MLCPPYASPDLHALLGTRWRERLELVLKANDVWMLANTLLLLSVSGLPQCHGGGLRFPSGLTAEREAAAKEEAAKAVKAAEAAMREAVGRAEAAAAGEARAAAAAAVEAAAARAEALALAAKACVFEDYLHGFKRGAVMLGSADAVGGNAGLRCGRGLARAGTGRLWEGTMVKLAEARFRKPPFRHIDKLTTSLTALSAQIAKWLADR